TGTGKTAAFGLPILHSLDKETPMGALILVPTRELAAQVAAEIEELGQFTPIRASCIIGGESMRHQSKDLKAGGHIIVGTPGRVMDMRDRGELTFDNVRFVVLDEVDRMLDIGFRDDIRKILKQVRLEHQTIFCSATLGDEIERLARTFMKPDAQKIMTIGASLTVSQVEQKYLAVAPWDKRTLLLHLLKHEEPDTTVVFCRTKATVHRVAEYLSDKGIDCREIHGDLAQNKRNRVMESMRNGNLDVLVASDLAARGLDIDHISHVINYDLPDDPEVYVHRIGRTARAGRRGIAWTFVMPDQGQMLTEIEKLTGVLIEKMDYPDFKPGPVPADAPKFHTPSTSRPDPLATLASRAQPLAATETEDAAELARRFPGGVVPQSAPKRTLGSKFKSRR
ncbi:MAG: DEAD/DEAH box helicase, partial [Planctomycetota bacterium]|nr:DEAD/DEAH box helicase [Planctomycetota bacterium]